MGAGAGGVVVLVGSLLAGAGQLRPEGVRQVLQHQGFWRAVGGAVVRAEGGVGKGGSDPVVEVGRALVRQWLPGQVWWVGEEQGVGPLPIVTQATSPQQEQESQGGHSAGQQGEGATAAVGSKAAGRQQGEGRVVPAAASTTDGGGAGEGREAWMLLQEMRQWYPQLQLAPGVPTQGNGTRSAGRSWSSGGASTSGSPATSSAAGASPCSSILAASCSTTCSMASMPPTEHTGPSSAGPSRSGASMSTAFPIFAASSSSSSSASTTPSVPSHSAQSPCAAADATASTPVEGSCARQRQDTAGKGGQHPCGHCGEPGAGKLCAACKAAWYCGPACQQGHWKVHRRQCKRLQRQQAHGPGGKGGGGPSATGGVAARV